MSTIVTTYVKGAIKKFGPNVSEKSVSRIAKAESHSRAILGNVDSSLKRKEAASGKHGGSTWAKNIEVLLKRVLENDVFVSNYERTHLYFTDFNRNRLDGLDMSDMFKWINKHKKYVSLGMRAR